ncbi:hypothetical protein NDA11_007358 [Ustilago hordei]|nr:hypothetical protein NDA11_007358 [Ustilago hordei]
MKILFICTAFNSLAQRTALVLRSHGHSVTIEYALSPTLMISAATLSSPDLILCPFLTKHVPPEIYHNYLTLIVHPGPPGDAGPSAIDWCLIGDLGEVSHPDAQLAFIDAKHSTKRAPATMRSHWAVTVLQAIEAFDAGPVWAFDQFELTGEAWSKSDLYRGPVTRAAVSAVLAAVKRVELAAKQESGDQVNWSPMKPTVAAPARYRTECVSRGVPFLGGRTHNRPLLRAGQRDFFPLLPSPAKVKLSADAILQRIRSADSQPGMLSTLLGTPLFLYNAHIQRDPLPPSIASRQESLNTSGTILATRQGAILVDVGADFPLWIGHLRRPKAKSDKYLHPKLPATMALLSLPDLASSLSLLDPLKVPEWSPTTGFGCDPNNPYARRPGTYQQVWIDISTSPRTYSRIAYIHAEFYNGAFSTLQCTLLLSAIKHALSLPGLKAIVLLGGSGYFSNGIALNVIEGSPDPSAEAWANINAIDDCVQALLAPKGVVTFAAIRGNAAAGGLAMATASDFVISTESAVLNPHYRGLGLYGSEWHTYSWYQRCGESVAKKFARQMLPMSATEAQRLGLVDYLLHNDRIGAQAVLEEIKGLVNEVMDANVSQVSSSAVLAAGAPWTRCLRLASAHRSQSTLLSEQILQNKTRYLADLFAESSCNTEPMSLEGHFLQYRKAELDQMTLDFFHPHRKQRFASRCTGFVRKLVPTSTPTRFALHRRYSSHPTSEAEELDEEEKDEFDGLAGIPASAAVARLPDHHPELIRVPREQVSGKEQSFRVGQDTLASTGQITPEQEGSQRSSTSTAPTTPAEGSPKAVLSLGDEEVHRMDIETTLLQVPSPSSNTGLASFTSQGTIKCAPAAISFAAAAGTQDKVRVVATRTCPTTREEGVKKGRLERFFASLSRKSRSNLLDPTRTPCSTVASKPVPVLSPSPPILKENKVDPTFKAKRRSSISEVLSVLQNSPSRTTPQATEGGPKSERRRSLRPTPSEGFSLSYDRGMRMTPRIVEENLVLSEELAGAPTPPKEGEKGEEGEEGEGCLWSCYYAENGGEKRRVLRATSDTA